MSYITSFMDGEKYGASEINKIVSRFITSGIEDPFIDGEPYNVRRLNDLSKPVTTRGVIAGESNALLVIKSGDEYFVSPGTAFFGNGSTLEVVESEPISLVDTSVANYVYLVSNEEENRNYIEVNTVEPDITNENIVMLCEISADGIITDRRCYATGKIRGMYQDNEFTLKCIRIQDTFEFPDLYEQRENIVIQHDLGCSDFHMMVFAGWNVRDENGNGIEEDDYDPQKGHTGCRYQGDSVILWLPRENLYFGIFRSPIGSQNPADLVLNNRFWLNYGNYVDISHFENNIWNFTYSFEKNHGVGKHNYDYKLFYI